MILKWKKNSGGSGAGPAPIPLIPCITSAGGVECPEHSLSGSLIFGCYGSNLDVFESSSGGTAVISNGSWQKLFLEI